MNLSLNIVSKQEMANENIRVGIAVSSLLNPSWCYLDEDGREIEEDLEMVLSRDY